MQIYCPEFESIFVQKNVSGSTSCMSENIELNEQLMLIIIIVIIIIINIINCNWVVNRWQWLFYVYTKYEIGY